MKEIFTSFLKIGITAFGGPAAHIAMMHDEFVERKKWVKEERYLELISLTSLIPGPNSTEMSMQVGYERGKLKGLIIAGFTFLLPATLITLLLSMAYKEYGTIPTIGYMLIGVQASVIAIILNATFKLGKKCMKNKTDYMIGVLVLVLCILGINEVLSLLIGTVVGILAKSSKLFSITPIIALIPTISPSLIFLKFLKIGSILFGSGYVLIAYLESEFVNTGILPMNVVLDGVAIGQFTPGPVLSTATFIGYYLGDSAGAVLATLGIFLPSFVFSFLIHPVYNKLKDNGKFKLFLQSINSGSLALLVFACYRIMINAELEPVFLIILGLSTLAVFFFKKLPSYYLVIIGAVLAGALNFLL